MHFKFRVLIDTESSACMLYSSQKGCVQTESRDLFKFWEIRDNISLTVQDRDIVAM